jgi:hypothetical protein
MNKMGTLKDVAASARLQKWKVDRSAVYRAAGSLLIVEERAVEALREMARTGDHSLDAEFPRLDLEAVLKSARRQAGVPVPVPRFAAFDTRVPDLRLGAASDHAFDGGARMFAYGETQPRWYGPFCDAIAARMRRRMICREVSVHALVVGATLGAWGLALFVFSSNLAIAASSIAAFFASVAYGIALYDKKPIFGGSRHSLSLALGGIVPDEARQIIRERGKDFERMYIVAEAGDWTWAEADNLPTRLVNGDPLLVGEKNGAFYLLHVFDMTPLEEYVRKEFTSGQEESK